MTHPPSGPSTPPPPSGPKGLAEPTKPPTLAAYLAEEATKCAVALDLLTLLLRTCQLTASRKLAGADPAARMRLDYALDSARRAAADLQNSGRDGKAAAAVSRPVQATRVVAGSYCFCSALLVGHEYDPQYCKGSAPTEYAARADRPMLPVRPTRNVEPEVADEDGVARGVPSGARFRAATHHSAGRPPASGGGFTLPRPPDFEIGVR